MSNPSPVRRRLPAGTRPEALRKLASVRRAAPQQSADTESGGVVSYIGDGGEDVVSSLLDANKPVLRAPRNGEYIHVSDLISRCARKRAILEKGKHPTAASPLSLMNALTYRQGEAIHDVIKETAALSDPSRVWGRWSCSCGHFVIDTPCTLAQATAQSLCQRCSSPASRYQEVTLRDEEHKIVGHPDLILWMPQYRAFHVAELKSISANLWSDLLVPMPDHVIQVLMYWRMLRLQGKKVMDRVSILYVNKGYVFRGKPYKEFTLDAKSAQERLRPYLDDAKDILVSRNGGELPPRKLCSSITCTTAKDCEVADRCFNGPGKEPVRVSFLAASGSRR